MNKIRSVFISDSHLGGKFSKTKQLLEFLKAIKEYNPEKLYLVGDFIDGWKLKRNWTWNDDCNLIVRKILSMVKHGTTVYYVAGNHDEFLRDFFHDSALDLGSIHVSDEFIHTTPDGRRLLIVHGDLFDLAITMKCGRFIAKLGDVGYDVLIGMNGILNFFRRKLHLNYWSLSKAIKCKVKKATSYVGDFEQILADYASEKDCQGVVCGHIHTTAMRKIGAVDYYNTGDWVESCSALLEFEDGTMELYHHPITH